MPYCEANRALAIKKLLCGFRKRLYPQYNTILNTLHDCQKCLYNSGKVATILMDLSKAFNFRLRYDLLIAKMAAYRFGKQTRDGFTATSEAANIE